MSRARGRMSILDNLEQLQQLEEIDFEDDEDDDDMLGMQNHIIVEEEESDLEEENSDEEEEEDEDDDAEHEEDGDTFDVGVFGGLGSADSDDLDDVHKDELVSHDSEERDSPGPLGYEDWSGLDYGEGDPSSQKGGMPPPRRKRESFNALSLGGMPDVLEDEPNDVSNNFGHRGTIGPMKRRVSNRRMNFSVSAGTSVAVPGHGRESVGQRSIMKRFTTRTFSTRISGRTRSTGASTSDGSLSFYDAVNDLGRSGMNDVRQVAAAAAVVAADTQVKPGHLFSVGDAVLVPLNLVNHTNMEDMDENFSVKPVNKFGYPPGDGRTEAERQGPYYFVMAVVQNVHFEEHNRYYTVVRADTGTEQRAEPGWMEPLRDPDGIQAASQAASQTAKMIETEAMEDLSCFARCRVCAAACASWPLRVAGPGYVNFRVAAKRRIQDLLFGTKKYSCYIRLTCVNILVLFSLVYLFIDVVPLAFFPPKSDYIVAFVGVTVWAVLCIELICEFLIRPPNYSQLIETERAYAPSTSRNINMYHLIFEAIALLLYVPSFRCIHQNKCGYRDSFTFVDASLDIVKGDQYWQPVVGRFILGITSLRLFGLVRHWKQMWINNTFADENSMSLMRKMFFLQYAGTKSKSSKDDRLVVGSKRKKANTEEEMRLKHAATIGTALMVVTSHRALFLLISIITVLPMLFTLRDQNHLYQNLGELLQQNNVNAPYREDCRYLEHALVSWIKIASRAQGDDIPNVEEDSYVLWAEIKPQRCDFQIQSSSSSFVVTNCSMYDNGIFGNNYYNDTVVQQQQLWNAIPHSCGVWNKTLNIPVNTIETEAIKEQFREKFDIRVGGITEYIKTEIINGTEYSVRVFFNQNPAITYMNMSLFILLATVLLLVFVGLTVLREDAGRLVLDPLRRMLKIVVRYADNPLSNDIRGSNKRKGKGGSDKDDDQALSKDQLGNYETEQLINAVAKIADLLRKCWGVAGAGIISSNLARNEEGRTVVFNPTVPGKRVYALFGFVAMGGFSKQLHALAQDVMILINDVAKVVHDEVYRWALGDSGQCNKNLGAAFLMVFKIGDFAEVRDKKKIATDVVFKTRQKSNARSATLRKRKGRGRGAKKNLEEDTLQLASLPGIQAFTDRALLGMLKSFAGIHRDKKLRNWSKDYRLGAGVGAYHVDIIYGMDAGWAVEGAVGSEYKIDATYLSPHVNMASRMMSASKQYGVTMLVSQAVEELLSKQARNKMRHLDTVYVKGSSVAQRIFTYDARHEGVDFFLIERTPEQADADADAYNTGIWENDQDLKAMRQHVTEEFMVKFKEGIKQYLSGDWKKAVETLMSADDLMIEAVIEEGYVDYDLDQMAEQLFDRRSANEEIRRLRNDYGDGACKCLIQYMERRDCIAPKSWHGVRKLESK